ncbi:MAG TPA: homoserine dehydrogenase, partial [Desulfobacteraceae bacterium]|nr:homoserine dehydrogenase [Desulfobacteraceae bacterium]
MKEIQVGLIGFGTVGSGLAEVLLNERKRLRQRTGLSIRLARVADIRISELPARFADVALTGNADDLFNDPDIDIVVELIGGIEPAKSFLLKAIAAGKHVVTANKALISQEGRDIFAAAAA